MKCPKCNAENKDTYAKCKKCGQLLVKQKAKEIIMNDPPYNWVPAAVVVAFFIVAILIIKLYLRY